MTNKIIDYFIIVFIAYIAVYTTNTLNTAETLGKGFFALLRIITTSILIALFMAFTDKPALNLIKKIMKRRDHRQKES